MKSDEFTNVMLYDSVKELSAELKAIRETCSNLSVEIRVLTEVNTQLRLKVESMSIKLDDLDKREAATSYFRNALKKLSHPGYLILMGFLAMVGVTHESSSTAAEATQIIKHIEGK